MAQVRFVTGNKILRILKSKALAPDLPEDIYYLIKKVYEINLHKIEIQISDDIVRQFH